MTVLTTAMLPEILLCAVACVLFLMGVSTKVVTRRSAAAIALLTMVIVFIIQIVRVSGGDSTELDPTHAVVSGAFTQYVKLIAAGTGILLVLLNMPTNRDGTGNSATDFGSETGEFFGLLLLSMAGLFIVAGANDIILLFLGIELASIPTYVMVSMSRPLASAQEAGVKYFFLGAMSAAVMLFGFSYLYGTTGTTSLSDITSKFVGFTGRAEITDWQLLGVLMLIAGFAFKMAAVPLHEYAGDVYQGAATPVTAFLSFVPKTSGFVALIKVLFAVTGGGWFAPVPIVKLLIIMAGLTMTFGNVLALLQHNIKRVLAYSSVAHTGYMLVGMAALVSTSDGSVQNEALKAVLFYLAAYGVMNATAFGVLMMLPARHPRPATSAEFYEDLAGQGRKHLWLGLAMAVACFSLTGLPLTIGFFGKYFLISAALHAHLNVLVVVLVANAAISAAYYLKIVVTMFLRTENAPTVTATYDATEFASKLSFAFPIKLAIGLSVFATLLFGIFFPATQALNNKAFNGTTVGSPAVMPETAMAR